MSQPLRVPYLVAYAKEHQETPTIALVGYRGPLDNSEIGVRIEVIELARGSPLGARRPPTHGARASLVGFAHSHPWAAAVLRRGVRLAGGVRSRLLNRSNPTITRHSELAIERGPSSAVTQGLERIAQTHRVDEIVVFDLFDLAPALKFGESHGARVLVR